MIRRRDNEPEKEEKSKDADKRPEKGIDNKLELLKYTSEVQSRIKKDITSDLVLCKLSEQDKIGVTEMTVNAYLAARQIKNVKHSAKKYEFDEKEQKWYITDIEPTTKEILDKMEEKVFDTFMTKINMCAILNRNVEKNNMLEILAGIRQEEIIEENKAKTEDGMVKKLMSKMKRKETEEEAEERIRG